jgi:hypothetical protein
MIMNSFRKGGLCLENSEVILQETHENSMLDADWEQLNSGSTFSKFVEVDAGVLTCEQQTVDDDLDQHVSHVSEGGTISDKEDGDEEVPIASHLELTTAVQTIRNYISAASTSYFDTICKLEKQTEDIHRQKKSKQCKIILEDCKNTICSAVYIFSFRELNVNTTIGCFKVHLHELQD